MLQLHGHRLTVSHRQRRLHQAHKTGMIMTSTMMATTATATATATMPFLALSDLPLRPSTLLTFTRRGFETTSDVEDARRHGLSNLAAELDLSGDLTEVAGLLRELDGCIRSLNNSNVSDINGRRQHHHSHHHQRTHSSSHISPTNVLTASELVHPRPPPPLPGRPGKVTQQQQQQQNCIVTFSQQVDGLLGGGIRLGEVTEIAGLPGCGKTQLVTQLAVLARLPQSLGGVEGRTLYIDTEGSFTPERCEDMAEALEIHIRDGQERRRRKKQQRAAKQQQQQQQQQQRPTDKVTTDSGGEDVQQLRDAELCTVDEILRSIHVFRVHDEAAMLSTLYSLPQYIENTDELIVLDDDVDDDELNHRGFEKEPYDAENRSDPSSAGGSGAAGSDRSLPVRLVVIDSIAFQFRAVAPTDPSYYAQRSKILIQLASFLGDLASRHNIAVVAINQMTTKMVYSSNNKYGDSNSALVPALGEAWAHATATRLLLSNASSENVVGRIGDSDPDDNDNAEDLKQNQQVRICELVKSSHRPSGFAKFIIVSEGIRGVGFISSNNVSNKNKKRPRPSASPFLSSSSGPGQQLPRQRDTNVPPMVAKNGHKH